MDAMSILEDLTRRGLSVSIQDARLAVTPSSSLTDADRDLIRAHKDELIERLTAPSPADGLRYATEERLADDRRTCAQCRMLTDDGGCIAARRGELRHAAKQMQPDITRLHRCVGYRPNAEDADRRSGLERWPGLSRDMAKEAAA